MFFIEFRGLRMLNKFDYFYKEVNGGIKITAVNDKGTDTIYIPKEIDGVPVTSVYFDERSEYQGIKVLSISADLESLYLHSKTFSKLEKIVFEKDFDGSAEFVRDLLSLWAVKNIKMKATIPEVVFKGTPNKFVVKQHLLLSNDEKKLIVALTRDSFIVPNSVNTICTKAILPTYKKTSIITYHSGITTIEDNPFGLDEFHSSVMEYAIVQMNQVPLKIKNIGSGLIIFSNDYHSGTKVKADGAHFFFDGSKLIIRTSAENITDEALKEIANIKNVSEVIIESKNSPFEIKDSLLLYKKNTLVCAIRKPNNKNPVYIPDYVKKTYVIGVKPENKSDDELKQESKGFVSNKIELACLSEFVQNKSVVERVPGYANRFRVIQPAKRIAPLNELFKLKNPVVIDKLILKESDFPLPKGRKKYGFVLDDCCKYVKEIVLPEGLTSFDIEPNIDGTSYSLERITFPSTISVGNILPKLNQFKKLMIVSIKPSKMIQVKFGALNFIVANLKRKSYNSLFYTYSYSDIDSRYESPFSSGSYGGITYISLFKQEKLLHHENGYYYLVENEDGKFYRLLKTDFVDTFDVPKEINGIKVRYLDKNCLSNVKKDPFADLKVKYSKDWDLELEGLRAYAHINGLEFLDE